ncbi:LOW QUALITY PROTEIN: Gag-pol polyprotein [Elysia marginata]|uniref:Gag-pol polyprotein n=1 Tax=Elysia marginata TaxID=1093978 RepID=A0AAV4EIH2_9GAST|nr:LOW QUALITY PROTEIN: Gag-pol polyprotein [Elysia marginata]
MLREKTCPLCLEEKLHILPESQGMTYLFTIIDRFMRWSEAVPLLGAHASSCATALLHHWVARFGVPEDITSDKGKQFTSSLWIQLNNLLGMAYHPQTNGLVKRLHRQLRASLKARTTNSKWFAELPMVLVGIRSSWRVDPGCSPAAFTVPYSTYLASFFNPLTSTIGPDLPFLKHLQQTLIDTTLSMFPQAWHQPILSTRAETLTSKSPASL